MSDKRQTVPIAGLVATIAVAVYMVVHLHAQGTAPTGPSTALRTGNFTNAASAEARDAQGQVLLQGQFAATDEDDDDTERKAVLKPTGIVADAAGEAEVEFDKSAPVTQEIEFSVRGLQAGAAVTFVIDGQEVGSATADRRGRAELEIDVRMPGAPAR